MPHTESADILIRLSVGLVMILFGANQVMKPANWLKFIPRPVKFLMPIDNLLFMRLHGCGNLGLGLLLASGLAQPLSIIMALGWWLWILPFAAIYDWTIGLRDFIVIAALTALLLLNV